MEAGLIWRQLRSEATGFAGEALDFLVSAPGQALYRDPDTTETKLYATLKKVSSTELRDRIDAIERYEHFCRLLHDAFEACRYEITAARRGRSPSELATLAAVTRAAERLPDTFKAAAEGLHNVDRRTRFQITFEEISRGHRAGDFVLAIYDHHRRIQRTKPPDGKAPWMERHVDGTLLIRPDYQLHKQPEMSTEFLNPYRLHSLWSFAADLGRV
jgi:hypothetical protein